MSRQTRTLRVFVAGLVAMVGIGVVASVAGAGPQDRLTSVNGSVWVANRSAHTIRAFDAATGEVVRNVEMRAGSQPGDLAYANGKLYVAEEFGTPPAIAIVDAESGTVAGRILLATGSRPHHVHASVHGDLVAVGLYGTDLIAVVETETDTLLGTWDTNPDPAKTSGRAHAGVFSKDGTLYVASDASNEVIALDPRTGEILWRMEMPGAHELALTRDGKRAYVSRRTANTLTVIDLRSRTATDVLTLALPDTLRLSAGDKQLTIGLRTTPAQVAVVDTRTFDYDLVRIGPPLDTTTIAGHQWTSKNGRFTFAAFEGGTSPGIAVIDHNAGDGIVQTLPYAGRPHGTDVAPARDDSEDEG
jgi:outer membrane protein assembly factor BamB